MFKCNLKPLKVRVLPQKRSFGCWAHLHISCAQVSRHVQIRHDACIKPVSDEHGHGGASSLLPSGAVLSLTMNDDGESCYSGGLDGTVRCWKMPDLNVDPYDNYGQLVSAEDSGTVTTQLYVIPNLCSSVQTLASRAVYLQATKTVCGV